MHITGFKNLPLTKKALGLLWKALYKSGDCLHNLIHTFSTYNLWLEKYEKDFWCTLVLKVSLNLLSNLVHKELKYIFHVSGSNLKAKGSSLDLFLCVSKVGGKNTPPSSHWNVISCLSVGFEWITGDAILSIWMAGCYWWYNLSYESMLNKKGILCYFF